MEDEFVLGIIEKKYLTEKCDYTEDEVQAMWDVPPVGPEIGPLVKYDFYHQHDIHCGPNGQYFKNFVPDEEMNRSWTSIYKVYSENERDHKNYIRVYNGYKLNLYTEEEHIPNSVYKNKGNVVFISKDYRKSVTIWNHDHIDRLNDTVHMHDILYFAACYYSHRIGRSAPYAGEFPKDRYAMFLQLFRADGAIAAAADEDGCFYRGALLEALKRMYIYTTYKKTSFDQETILLAMRVVQEVAPSITPKYTPGRPTCTYDVDFDEFMYFDVRYPNPDGSLNDIYANRSRESREDDISRWSGRPYKPLITSDTTLDDIKTYISQDYNFLQGNRSYIETYTRTEKRLFKTVERTKKRIVGFSEAFFTFFDGNGNQCNWIALYKTKEKITISGNWTCDYIG